MSPNLDYSEPSAFARMQELDRIARTGYSEAGLLAIRVRDTQLWRDREGCTSWTSWLKSAAPFSYAHVHAAIADIERLPDVPDSELAQIPHCGLVGLQGLSTAVRADPDIIEAAKHPRTATLTALVQQRYPGQHISSPKMRRFMLDPQQDDAVQQAIEERMAMGATSPSAALAAICEEWLDQKDVMITRECTMATQVIQ